MKEVPVVFGDSKCLGIVGPPFWQWDKPNLVASPPSPILWIKTLGFFGGLASDEYGPSEDLNFVLVIGKLVILVKCPCFC